MTASVEPRKSEIGRRKSEIKELFRQEDIRLNWTSVRRTVGLQNCSPAPDLLPSVALWVTLHVDHTKLSPSYLNQTTRWLVGVEGSDTAAGLERVLKTVCRGLGLKTWATHAF